MHVATSKCSISIHWCIWRCNLINNSWQFGLEFNYLNLNLQLCRTLSVLVGITPQVISVEEMPGGMDAYMNVIKSRPAIDGLRLTWQVSELYWYLMMLWLMLCTVHILWSYQSTAAVFVTHLLYILRSSLPIYKIVPSQIFIMQAWIGYSTTPDRSRDISIASVHGFNICPTCAISPF